MSKALTIAALVLFAGTAYAAEVREARPVACLDYSVAKLPDGSSVAMCVGKKGKKPRLLRSFAMAKVTDPDTGVSVPMIVGFP